MRSRSMKSFFVLVALLTFAAALDAQIAVNQKLITEVKHRIHEEVNKLQESTSLRSVEVVADVDPA